MKKNFTLIEMVAVLVVFSVAIPSLLGMFSHLTKISYQHEIEATATQIAQYILEEIRSKRFDESGISPWTSVGDLGPDTSTTGLDGSSSENGIDRGNWDDVDDYNGYVAPFADDPSYEVSVDVFYVDGDGSLNTSVGSVTEYKHVRATISHSPDIEVKMVTLITPLEFL